MQPPLLHCLQPFLNLGTVAAGVQDMKWNQPQSLKCWNCLRVMRTTGMWQTWLLPGVGFNRETWCQEHFQDINISLSCLQPRKMKRSQRMLGGGEGGQDEQGLLWTLRDAQCCSLEKHNDPIPVRIADYFARHCHCQNFVGSLIMSLITFGLRAKRNHVSKNFSHTDRWEAKICPVKTDESDENLMKKIKYSDVLSTPSV